MSDGPAIRIPPSVAPLVTPNTFFLLNKSDLVTPSDSATMKLHNENMWVTSLSTGDGAMTFLDDFSKALQKRYGRPIYIRPAHVSPRCYLDTTS